MILTAAIILGLLAGLANAWWNKRPYQAPDLRYTWLVLLAFIPQFLIFRLPETSELLPLSWVAAVHVISQVPLLLFVWHNRRQPAFSLLGLGLAMNAAVILVNGGFMPIAPAIVERLFPVESMPFIDYGHRLMTTKNIVLLPEYTRLEWLSDRYLLTRLVPYPAALSLGDYFISAGIFFLLAMQRYVSYNGVKLSSMRVFDGFVRK